MYGSASKIKNGSARMLRMYIARLALVMSLDSSTLSWEIGGEHQAAQHPAHHHPAVSLIGPEDVLIARGIVELLLSGVGEHPVVRQLAEVDLRSLHRERHGRGRRQILDEQERQPILGHHV